MILRQLVVGLVALAAPLQFAAGSIVTYEFEGTFYASNLPDIPIGTPFAGIFSYDTNALILTTGPNYIDYSTGRVDLTIGTSSLTTTGIIDLRLANDVGVGLPTGFFPHRDLFEFDDFLGIAATGPLAADHLITLFFLIVYPLGTLGDLALPTSVPPQFDASYIALFDDAQVFAQGSFSSVVPEPATIALIAMGLLAIRGRSLLQLCSAAVISRFRCPRTRCRT
jgi:hypothetical protein